MIFDLFFTHPFMESIHQYAWFKMVYIRILNKQTGMEVEPMCLAGSGQAWVKPDSIWKRDATDISHILQYIFAGWTVKNWLFGISFFYDFG